MIIRAKFYVFERGINNICFLQRLPLFDRAQLKKLFLTNEISLPDAPGDNNFNTPAESPLLLQ
jgi:hypothetical protein